MTISAPRTLQNLNQALWKSLFSFVVQGVVTVLSIVDSVFLILSHVILRLRFDDQDPEF